MNCLSKNNGLIKASGFNFFILTGILFLLCCRSAVVAQSPDNLLQQSLTELAKGKSQSAFQLAGKAMALADKQIAKSDSLYGAILWATAKAASACNYHDTALIYYSEATRTLVPFYTKSKPEFTYSLVTTFQMFVHISNKQKACTAYENALQKLSKLKVLEYSIFTEITNLYLDAVLDKDKDVELNQQKCSKVKSNYGLASMQYHNLVDSLARSYYKAYKYKDAKFYYTELIASKRALKKTKDTAYVNSLYNLGYLYFTSFKYDSAALAYKEVIKIWEANKEKPSERFANAYFNVGVVLMLDAKYKEVIPLFKKAIYIVEQALGKKHYMYSMLLIYLGSMNMLDKNFIDAEKYYKEDFDLKFNPADSLNSILQADLAGLSSIYQKTNRMSEADRAYKLANLITLNQIMTMFRTVSLTSEKKVTQYFMGFSYNLDWYYSYFFDRIKQNPGFAELIYNDELVKKGLVMRAIKHKIAQVQNSSDTALVNNFNQWVRVRQMLYKLYLLPVSERKLNTLDLEKKMSEIESNMYYKLYQTDTLQELLNPTWKDVRSSLKDNEAAIEFFSYNYIMPYSEKWTNDSVIYGAIVLKKNFEKPEVRFLFCEKDFEKFLKSQTGAKTFDNVNNLYGNNKKGIKPAGDSLYRFIWKPLDELLTDVKKVYFSPTGLLHKISFNAISISDSVLLCDKYNLSQVSSTSVLTSSSSKFVLNADYKALLYGGIFYDLDSALIEQSIKKYKMNSDIYFHFDRSFQWADSLRGRLSWGYLQGSLNEVENIKSVLSNQQIKAQELTKSEAVEESIKIFNGNSPDILHIATHGFFFPEVKPKKQKSFFSLEDQALETDVSKNPLLRSGLVFAGANQAWQGKIPVPGADDGILTSLEVSALNLSTTRLVVLSACETGLGDIKGSEGVFGLQRAFKMAGVEYIIMSLWQIPDKQTVELMTLFYGYWLDGLDITQAFYNAQAEMRKKYPPFYWAAFILVK